MLDRFRYINYEADKGKAQESLRKTRENNVALAPQLGNPTKLFYPAGRYDITPLTIPSVRVMAIIDMVPLLFAEPRPDNSYSSSIYSILEQHNGSYVSCAQLFQEPSFLSSQQAEFIGQVKGSLETYASSETGKKGYELGEEKDITDVEKDSFVDIFTRAILLGADISTLQVGKFRDDFKVRYELDGELKTLLFKQAKIDKEFSDPTSANYLWAATCFDEYGDGSTALVVKGDLKNTAAHVVDAVNPDTIFGSGQSITGLMYTLLYRYNFVGVDKVQLPHPYQAWGYGYTASMQIGRRIATLSE